MTEIWQNTLQDLKEKVSDHVWSTWFEKISFRKLDDGVAELHVADDFSKAWIEDNYLDLVRESMLYVSSRDWKLAVKSVGATEVAEEIAIDVAPTSMAARQGRMTLPIEQRDIFAAPALSWRDRVIDAGMNPRYTFDEFVVGGSNQFVHAACSAVATNPARVYNPLFIFGGVGLGKTHLLQAVGCEILRRDPTQRVLYLSSEEFMNQLITSLRNKDMNSFRTQFRNDCDVLLIDDIQFIGGKDSTQEEFFHTFNALHQAGKQIVMTSDRPPRELPGIEDRLASRFSWGLIADVQAPSVETRMAILEKKAEADGIPLAKDVALLIANAIRSNVRELEGTLIRLGAQASLTQTMLTADFAREMLRRMNIEDGRQITIDRIIKLVASRFDIKPADIKGNRRTRDISVPRQLAMFLSRQHTDESFPQIGRKFGGKDHTSVIAACRRMEQEVRAGGELAEIIGELESQLR
ncbi:MAG: chromosomal replication initiator protein DnaA [bacterium]